MFLCACSAGVLPIFYESVEYAIVDGAVKLIKDYNIAHSIYTVYVVSFMIAAIVMTVYAISKKKLVFYRYIIMIVMIASANIVIWLAERFTGGGYEFLSVSYIFTCFLMVMLYSELSENGLLDSFNSVISVDDRLILKPSAEPKQEEIAPEIAIDFSDTKTLNRICEYYSANKIISRREAEVLALMLQNYGRKDISDKLFVTENTIKSHISKIYSKLEVCSRDELLSKISEQWSAINNQ